MDQQELQALVNEMLQQRQSSSDKTTTKPIYKIDEIRRFFINVLEDIIREKSNGEKSLKLNPEMANAINYVCGYLNREPWLLEQEGFSFNKGLWIYGAFGSGKSVLMLAYRKAKLILDKETVGFKTCTEMNEAFQKTDVYLNRIAGHDALKTFANRHDKTERIFDDLGEEETTVLDYGNRTCIMALILAERYKGFPSVKTHVTTNLTKSQISEVYGGRIESRMYEMFNFVKLGATKDSIDNRKT